MGKDVIIACDFDSAAKTFAFLDQFTGKKPFVKIGIVKLHTDFNKGLFARELVEECKCFSGAVKIARNDNVFSHNLSPVLFSFLCNTDNVG